MSNEGKEKAFAKDVFGNDIFMAEAYEINKHYTGVRELLMLIGPYVWGSDDISNCYVSDISSISDFCLEVEEIKELSNKLGFEISSEDLIIDIAKRLEMN